MFLKVSREADFLLRFFLVDYVFIGLLRREGEPGMIGVNFNQSTRISSVFLLDESDEPYEPV